MKLLLIIFIFTLSLFANTADSLKELVQIKSDKVLTILKDNNLTKEVKYNQINEEVNNLFDYDIMAMLSLGKKGRKLLDNKQKKLFVKLFTEHIKKSYFEKSDLLTDKKIIVKETKKQKSRIFIISEIVGKKDSSEMIYKFHKNKQGKWLIYDVEISGVSIITSYRKQFQEILKDNDVEKLLDVVK